MLNSDLPRRIFRRSQLGASMLEYAMIAALVSCVCIAAVSNAGFQGAKRAAAVAVIMRARNSSNEECRNWAVHMGDPNGALVVNTYSELQWVIDDVIARCPH